MKDVDDLLDSFWETAIEHYREFTNTAVYQAEKREVFDDYATQIQKLFVVELESLLVVDENGAALQDDLGITRTIQALIKRIKQEEEVDD